MVNADLMDGIDRALRQARARRAEPFGGVQVIMFGDRYQLAPVPPRGDEARYINDHYRSFWFFDAHVWAGHAAQDGVLEVGVTAPTCTSESSRTSTGSRTTGSRRC